MKKYIFIFCIFTTAVSTFGQNVTVIGIGRLGICFALSLEKAGCNVLGVDVSEVYVSKINEKSLHNPEPDVVDLLKKSKNFRATTSLQEALDFSDLILITVATTIGNDAYNFDAINQLLTNINSLSISNKHIVINSTLYPGYINDIALPLLSQCTNITISYNPPFIAQGEIIRGLTSPDMVLIGQATPEVGDILENVYAKMCVSNPTISRMSVESAEITKLAVNCFITMKIAYANLVGDIADQTSGADKYAILSAAGKDTRIGCKYLLPGYGFGGPCFPRDNRGLGRYAASKGIEPLLFKATDECNKNHAYFMAQKLIDQNLPEYSFEDISYKPNSAVKILEESQKLAVARIIASAGKKVTIIDTQEVIFQVKAIYGDLFTYAVMSI